MPGLPHEPALLRGCRRKGSRGRRMNLECEELSSLVSYDLMAGAQGDSQTAVRESNATDHLHWICVHAKKCPARTRCARLARKIRARTRNLPNRKRRPDDASPCVSIPAGVL